MTRTLNLRRYWNEYLGNDNLAVPTTRIFATVSSTVDITLCRTHVNHVVGNDDCYDVDVTSATPMILLYARVYRQAQAKQQINSTSSIPAFVVEYLLIWPGFSLAAVL